MNFIENAIARYPVLRNCDTAMENLTNAIVAAHKNGNKILLCGNGGSASDCEHISGELLKGFLLKRPYSDSYPQEFKPLQMGISAIPLSSLTASMTAFANDVNPKLCFAQLTASLGRRGDVFLGISTSGNSGNVVEAAKIARALGLITACLTGDGGGRLGEICDIVIPVPETETYKVQELHLPVYHAVCAQAEHILFS